MNYGLYVAASGMLVNMYRMDVLGNNLANINTTAFKPEATAFHWREAERLEAGLTNMPPKRLLERLGGGVHLSPNVTLFKDGQLVETGNPLDLAIQGEGFFKFAMGRGEGNERLRFSRDGRFTIGADGYLTHAASGMRVLDEGDNPIRLEPTGKVMIQPDGAVMQDGQRVGRLGVVVPPRMDMLAKAGANTFTLSNTAQASLLPSSANLKQGWLESSAVDGMSMMMELASANGAIGANARMIRMHDELMNTAINRFGRVA